MRYLLIFVLVCFLQAGSPPDAPVVTTLSNPTTPGSISPALTGTPNGFLLSWYEPRGKSGYALRYASWEAAWSPVRTVIVRDRLMRHPAELPEVLRLPDGSLIAHWLELTGAGPWADSLYFSRSTDDGQSWSQPEIVHGDRSPCGHGLASIAVSGPHAASVFWLNDSPSGSTQLRTADIRSNGDLNGEQALDSDTCSCCPTTAVKTAKGLLAAYRGRTTGEVRDIFLVDNYAGRWSAPHLLHRDNWRITACPVNGASLSADGRKVVIAWYTGAQNDSRVEVAFSSDSGQTFDPPLRITSERVAGHVSATLLPNGHAFIAWVENAETTAQLLVREVTKDGSQSKAAVVATGTVRGLGYPRLQSAAGRMLLTWVDGRSPERIATAWIGVARSASSWSKGQ